MEFTDRFRINDNDYTSFTSDLADRFVETSRIENADRSWPTRIGYYHWQVGDRAAVHLTDPLPWTLVELRITEVINRQSYRVVIVRFDGQQGTLAGLSIGDELAVKSHCFFSVWGPQKTREDSEGGQKIYVEGTATRLGQIPPNQAH